MRQRIFASWILLCLVVGMGLPLSAQTRRPGSGPTAVQPNPVPATVLTEVILKPTQEVRAKPDEGIAPVQPGPGLWRDPGAVETLDLANGVGGLSKAPQPPFTFIEEDLGGSNPKVKVKDAAGREWGVKWGSEVNAEVFATRLVWAAGYFVEADYFIASGTILGARKLGRAKKYIASDGSFRDARFELKEKGIKKFNQEEGWRWDNNPFVGTKELNGLKILVMLTSNWDSKDQRDVSRGSNTAIFKVKATGEERYLITDWGGSMGKWGGVLSREKWDCKGFSHQTRDFVTDVDGNRVVFGYKGQRTDDIKGDIHVSDVKWLMNYIGRITDQQIREGLRASGADANEVDCFTSAIRDRISQLKTIAETGR